MYQNKTNVLIKGTNNVTISLLDLGNWLDVNRSRTLQIVSCTAEFLTSSNFCNRELSL